MSDRKEYQRTWQAELKRKRAERGLCIGCGKRPPVDGKKNCAKCLERISREHKKYYEKRLSAGLCIKCGKNIPSEGRKTCDECLIKCRKPPKSNDGFFDEWLRNLRFIDTRREEEK